MSSDRDKIEHQQLTLLKTLIETCQEGNKFWQQRLNACAVNAQIESLHLFSDKMSFSTKTDFSTDQSDTPPYGTNLSYPIEQYNRISQTSGTTGKVIRWLDTAEDWQWMVDNWKIIFKSAGITYTDRVIFPFSFSPFIGFWLAFEAATQLRCLTIPAANLSSILRLKMIIENCVTCICCTPTYGIRLGEIAKQAQLTNDLSSVKVMILAGEPGGSLPETRKMLKALWPGVNIIDHHGMTEVGPVSYQCPAQPGKLHILESAYYAEVIDLENQKPVSVGVVGELVLTPLGRLGSPVLRYRTGDLVKLGDSPCLCGTNEITLEGGILGRSDDMVVIRGVNIYPSGIESVVRQFSEIVEYQVIISKQNTLTEITIDIEVLPKIDNSDVIVAALVKKLKDTFSIRVNVIVAPCDTLPRYELKSKRWQRV